MSRKTNACLICGEELKYYDTARKMECMICHNTFDSYASCMDGHYVCDACHAEKGIDIIIEGCKQSTEKNPIQIMEDLMQHPFIYMHGPEHHIMVGAALITAFYNCGGFESQDRTAKERFFKALEEMKSRGSQYPGGSCGFWGCCGAAVSTGMFFSIVTETTPLSGKTWGSANEMTSRALDAIAKLGGPRCCKRNSFTAALAAIEFVEETLKIRMERPEHVRCDFSEENQQCIRLKCPYYQGEKNKE